MSFCLSLPLLDFDGLDKLLVVAPLYSLRCELACESERRYVCTISEGCMLIAKLDCLLGTLLYELDCALGLSTEILVGWLIAPNF